jgi:hypothetical protein
MSASHIVVHFVLNVIESDRRNAAGPAGPPFSTVDLDLYNVSLFI